MKILEELEKKKLAALEAGNVSLYIFYDGQFTERFHNVIVTVVGDAQKNEELLKQLREFEEKYVVKNEPKKTEALPIWDMCFTVRKRLKLSQREFAKKIGVSQPVISRIEEGKHGRRETERKIREFYNDTFYEEQN